MPHVSSEEAPSFTKNLSNVEGTETDSVKMICEVSKPSAEVTWYRGDEELPEGGRYDQIMDGRKRILIIQDLRMEDAGEYNCRLSPTVRTSATLKLNGKNKMIIATPLAMFHQRPGSYQVYTSISLCSIHRSRATCFPLFPVFMLS